MKPFFRFSLIALALIAFGSAQTPSSAGNVDTDVLAAINRTTIGFRDMAHVNRTLEDLALKNNHVAVAQYFRGRADAYDGLASLLESVP